MVLTGSESHRKAALVFSKTNGKFAYALAADTNTSTEGEGSIALA